MAAGLVDTSVLIGVESGRQIRAAELPSAWSISAITLGELQLGVLMAVADDVRATRLATIARINSTVSVLPFDAECALAFARLVAGARRKGNRPRVMDSLIAATAARYDLPLFTQDADFYAFPGLDVVQI